ncbi:Fic family protein [Roseovarius sp. LXJ103]|uniref:Fic family protein n=1 Tax=Roseovarius carneus TaxID=2853164 RepID=UPI000D6054F4|nr:Fic family protein [Roseovarius carneus]MBZ8117847.1 Fic family protein [Roseovarius carneus]PWE36391.1 cell filamentation protein Fic [Pelagicola sp. LXJ1103]
MVGKTEILIHNTTYDSSEAVDYHYGVFPPPAPDLNLLQKPFAAALMSLTKYDTLLRQLPNSELLLAPLRARDAVVSSRMEGTISTIEEVLRLEADADEDTPAPIQRNDTLEVALYARALRQAEKQIADGYKISEHLIKSAHRVLLSHGRGAEKRPGQYKLDQNYVGDRPQRKIKFIPINAHDLPDAMNSLVGFITDSDMMPLLKTAIAHAEFEALHPFEDGNGRVGRMLITLMLWQQDVLSAPRFFVSDYFERHKDEYIARMRAVSSENDWTSWCHFFLEALGSQANENLAMVGSIQAHYDHMREQFRDVLRSQWSVNALDFIFANPIFRNNRFTRNAGIPKPTAHTFTRKLQEAGLITVLEPPAGRAPGLYAFPSLLKIVQEPR